MGAEAKEVSEAERSQQQLLLEVTVRMTEATTEDGVAQVISDQGIAALGGAAGGLGLVDRTRTELRHGSGSPLPRGSADRW
jgi:hypothetical protein